jgi:hypothetical protein
VLSVLFREIRWEWKKRNEKYLIHVIEREGENIARDRRYDQDETDCHLCRCEERSDNLYRSMCTEDAVIKSEYRANYSRDNKA